MAVDNGQPSFRQRFEGGARADIVAQYDELGAEKRVILGALRVKESKFVGATVERNIEFEGLVRVAQLG